MADSALSSATFRFYEELNDFLPVDLRKRVFVHRFFGAPTVKDCIESIGVPHTEVDLILANDESVGFDYHMQDHDRVAVYPVFEGLDISGVARLRDRPLRRTRFILDVHLGKLARELRLFGFDSLYRNDFRDAEIVEIASSEKRVVLTRDLGILKNRAVTHGYWLRSQNPAVQLEEVIARFDLRGAMRPLTRCLACNGMLEPCSKKSVLGLLPAETARWYEEFSRCTSCGKVYWKGSHYAKLIQLVERRCGR